ncbi:hypothetical protein AB5J56_00670 [Streptomyces sp. R21]|uniref:Uncharacterized protein n=1 Tax=Streptomyces sp. R21 TaxID=3238627 RepID=A0AB39NX98_9ACTN
MGAGAASIILWSPPTRGWSAEAALELLVLVVVPADAGMFRQRRSAGPEPCLVNDVLGTSSWYWALPVLSRAIPEAVRRVAYVLDEHEQAERERW